MSGSAPKLILASASPRRQELISLFGVPFEVVVSRYEEPPPPSSPANIPELVMDLAANKAEEVARRLSTGWIVGADTLVALTEPVGLPLGKPRDDEDARRMIRLLAGREHFVFTGIAVIPPWQHEDGPRPVRAFEKTGVTFRELSQAMIDRYVATGEPRDKAGAYGAQGFAAPFIERFDGDFFNVVGLPLCRLGKVLDRCGYGWQSL